jgi:sulfur-carrier protein adenylyltransferase/sulfurtransferase
MEPLVKERAELTKNEIERFSRHLILPDVGREGQERLKAASVLIIGTGGLGSPMALYLAAAGVGRLGLVDYDVVDESNLQRQIIHGVSTVGISKLDSAEKRLKDLNPNVVIDKYNVPLMADNALEIMEPYDVIVDGTDNFPTRYLVNDAAVKLGKPNVYASIFRFEGQVSVFWAEQGPCYRCMFPSPPPPGLVPNCAEGGVLGVLPGTVGTLQATEVIKLIVGTGEPLIGRMLLYDAQEMDFTKIRVQKDPNCPVCGVPQAEVELIDYEQFCGMPAHDHSDYSAGVAVLAGELSTNAGEMTVKQLKARIDAGEDLYILDVRNPVEWEIAALDGVVETHRLPKPEIEAAKSAIAAGRETLAASVIAQIPNDREVIVHCRSGVRSADVINMLKELGYENDLINLKGGILAWADEIDHAMPTY